MKIDAYIRVSQVGGRSGETFISPEVQEERIRAWCAAHGHEISEAGPDNGVWREMDVSGGKMDRKKLNEIMRRIESGESEGIVVYRLDRFGRTLVGALQIIDRISKTGALFASVSDSFDITTPTGKVVLRIMLSLAEFELDRIRENWREARTRAVGRGVHISGRCPTGYRRTKGGRLEVDPDVGPLVTEAFRRRASGEGWNQIRHFLNGSADTHDHWNTHTVQRLIRNRVYLGEATSGYDEVHEDAHPALTDPATWQAAQDRRGPRHARHESVVVSRGLVRCSGCRYTMNLIPVKRRDGMLAWDFRCRRAMDVGDCPSPVSVVAVTQNGSAGVDDLIVAAMFRRLELVEFEAFDASGDDLAALEADFQRAETKYNELVVDTELEEQIGRRAFRARLAAFEAVRDEKRALWDEALRRAGRSKLDRPWRELREEWPGLTVEQRRRHLANTIQAVFVRPRDEASPEAIAFAQAHGRYIAAKRWDGSDDGSRDEALAALLGTQVHIVWATEPPLDVPRQGRRDWTPTPFTDFPDANPGNVGMALA
jgi:DNA invertase Pin-like site-specific DNA recombinase